MTGDEFIMKKIAVFLMAFVLLACSAAFAEEADAGRTVVTAMAAWFNPEEPVSVAMDAKILSCDGKNCTLVPLVPERYPQDDVRALKAGDAIFTQGREVVVRTVTEEDGFLVLNKGEEDEVSLFECDDLNFGITDLNDNTWTEFPEVTVPVSDHLLFLDEIDPESGSTPVVPTVHNRDGFLSLMKSESDPGFDIRNVLVAFDEHGELALVRRFYVPWQ